MATRNQEPPRPYVTDRNVPSTSYQKQVGQGRGSGMKPHDTKPRGGQAPQGSAPKWRPKPQDMKPRGGLAPQGRAAQERGPKPQDMKPRGGLAPWRGATRPPKPHGSWMNSGGWRGSGMTLGPVRQVPAPAAARRPPSPKPKPKFDEKMMGIGRGMLCDVGAGRSRSPGVHFNMGLMGIGRGQSDEAQ
ncbi:uncharacterized protein LOC144171803 [Haemaphysalis longicornis]